MNIALIVNELAINASKHAYDGAPGVLYVHCRRDPVEDLLLSVADDGPGLPDGFRWEKGGLGMSIINSIARQLGATMSASTRPEGGSCFILRVPRQSAAPEHR